MRNKFCIKLYGFSAFQLTLCNPGFVISLHIGLLAFCFSSLHQVRQISQEYMIQILIGLSTAEINDENFNYFVHARIAVMEKAFSKKSSYRVPFGYEEWQNAMFQVFLQPLLRSSNYITLGASFRRTRFNTILRLHSEKTFEFVCYGGLPSQSILERDCVYYMVRSIQTSFGVETQLDMRVLEIVKV